MHAMHNNICICLCPQEAPLRRITQGGGTEVVQTPEPQTKYQYAIGKAWWLTKLCHAALVGLSNTTGAIDLPFGTGRVQGLGTDRLPVTPLQFHFHSPSKYTINGERACYA